MDHAVAATNLSVPRNSTGRALNIGLWVTQGLLAATFAMAGATKLSTPIDVLATQMPWVTGSMGPLVRFIGSVEVLGAIGLVLPAALRIMPRSTPLAAVGLATVMLLASITHLSRGEAPMIVANLVLGAAAAFVAWGRFVRAPIAPRSA